MTLSKALTWDNLANEYKKITGRSAYIKSMDSIFDWAEKQTDKFYVNPEKRTIHKIIKMKSMGNYKGKEGEYEVKMGGRKGIWDK